MKILKIEEIDKRGPYSIFQLARCCSKCGGVVNGNARYCSNCGKKFASAPSTIYESTVISILNEYFATRKPVQGEEEWK